MADPDLNQRLIMVKEQIMARGVQDPKVLSAMSKVPRHLFVPQQMRDFSYEDGPLPIGHNQTISQPYIVALMTELLELSGNEKVLEIGTGSGYQTAILAECASLVFSIERIEELADSARTTLNMMGYSGIHIIKGNGYHGLPDHAPFDRIIITAAPPHIPEILFDQLNEKGILVAPTGTGTQKLVRYKKENNAITSEDITFVRFVPLIDSDI